MIFPLYDTIFLFFIYSFLGWCIEVAFVAVTTGKVQNRGFLNGPVCPIYGCGMMGVLMVLTPISDNWGALFLGGVIICSAVECSGGWILNKIFHMRWWDYSDKPFNLGGYICLGFSLMWGLGVIFAVRFAHPPIYTIVKKLRGVPGYIIISVIGVIFLIDMIVTLKNLIGIKSSLGQLDIVAKELHDIENYSEEHYRNSKSIFGIHIYAEDYFFSCFIYNE